MASTPDSCPLLWHPVNSNSTCLLKQNSPPPALGSTLLRVPLSSQSAHTAPSQLPQGLVATCKPILTYLCADLPRMHTHGHTRKKGEITGKKKSVGRKRRAAREGQNCNGHSRELQGSIHCTHIHICTHTHTQAGKKIRINFCRPV